MKRLALAFVALCTVVAFTSGGSSASTASATKITVGTSQFGPMLFDGKNQAIYVFLADKRSKSVCYGECAKLWPPVYTSKKAIAGKGIKKTLLGVTKRRNGRLQVTYRGYPLYYYAHEGPGQVLCHNVDNSGGIWKVQAPSGRPRE